MKEIAQNRAILYDSDNWSKVVPYTLDCLLSEGLCPGLRGAKNPASMKCSSRSPSGLAMQMEPIEKSTSSVIILPTWNQESGYTTNPLPPCILEIGYFNTKTPRPCLQKLSAGKHEDTKNAGLTTGSAERSYHRPSFFVHCNALKALKDSLRSFNPL
jgi:hypothetical protein